MSKRTPLYWLVIYELDRQHQQPGFQQFFRQPVQGLGKLVGDGTNSHPQHDGCFCLGVLLKHNAAEHHAVERAKLVEASLHVEDEDDRVLEGADGTAGAPAPGDGISQDIGRPAHLHGCVEITPQQALGMLAIEAQTDHQPGSRRFYGRLCGWRRGRSLCPCSFCPLRAANFPNHRQLKGRAHTAPPVASATAQTLTSVLRPGRPRRLRLSGVGKSFSLTSHSLQYTLPWVWARYQRHPHPSQIFNCTRKSMTKSPCSCFLPAALY